MHANKAYILILFFFALVSCTSSLRDKREEADRLNRLSYVSRYKNLETTRAAADSAYQLSVESRYAFGRCDALCNLAFYSLARMNYDEADAQLLEAGEFAPDNTSKLCVEVLFMRLCQRRSLNKEFYIHKFQADRLISRIHNNLRSLTPHQRRHYTWARSEYGIVLSAYLYYLGHEAESSEAILSVATDEDIYLRADTAQWFGYLYNVGSGGAFSDENPETVARKEFSHLVQCYVSASNVGYVYWEANALQSLSEHLSSQEKIDVIRKTDAASLRYLNDRDVPDSLLSQMLAEKALDLFVRYGDIYQSASAWRTLSDTYFRQGDYEAMLNCLLAAMSDTLIEQAPTIVSSINGRLCMAYSAMNDKQTADFLRNEYLDIQDSIRQDRQLEARTEELSAKLDIIYILTIAIVVLLIAFSVTLFILIKYRKRHSVEKRLAHLTDKIEEKEDEERMLTQQISDARRLNIEQHAKIAMIQSIQPLIDRMHVAARGNLDDPQTLAYLSDLCRSVESGNEQLTRWIQLRKGSVKLKVETFPIQELFDILALNRVSFANRGITLEILPSPLHIKADRTLTLFLLNTIADNARKFTPEGGSVTVTCEKSSVDGYADIAISDTGRGMPQEEADHLFEYRVKAETQENQTNFNDQNENLAEQKSHGFGLMNCRGIIDRYRKSSTLFAQSAIKAISRVGEGTTITFRLPYVVKSLLLALLFFISSVPCSAISSPSNLAKASAFCDSMYQCNISARYADCLVFADSCQKYIDLSIKNQKSTNQESLNDLLLSMYNEAAVASLALHDWQGYMTNNNNYIALYRECSTDKSLPGFYRQMKRYETYANLGLFLLGVLVLALVWLFYRFYYRDFIIEKQRLTRRLAALEEKNRILNSELARLHVAISLAENSLSTIKHETMYYPSRIATLIDNCTIDDLQLNDSTTDKTNSCKLSIKQLSINQQLKELVSYYRALYLQLSSHCQRLLSEAPMQVSKFPLSDIIQNPQITNHKSQIINHKSQIINHNSQIINAPDITVVANAELLAYLLYILKKKNSAPVEITSYDTETTKGYVRITVECKNLHYTADQIATLFQPQTCDPDFLIIKQILREIGDRSFRYASGITATHNAQFGTTFLITLPC